MKLTGNFSKKIYIILILVLLFGLLLQFAHSKFVLQFQQNQSLIEEKKEIMENGFGEQKPIASGNAYCVFYDKADAYSNRLKANAIQSLEYMKMKTLEVNVEERLEELSNCKVVILATDKIGHLGDIENVEQYVHQGGYILFMSVLEPDDHYQILYRKVGVTSFHDYINTKGIKLTSNVLIGEKDLVIDDEFITNTSLSIALADEAELLAKSYQDIPLLWKSNYGEGAFMSFNGTLLQEKINRGFFVGALSLLEPNFIYPIFNLKVFFIDDFPAPIVRGTTQVIYDEYKKDIPSFYQEIWWPDMLKTARDYDLKYTGAIIETYNDRVEPPFDNIDDKDTHYLISYGRELIDSGGELGFHGYNHQSLVMDKEVSKVYGYKEWKKKSDMFKSIQELVTYTKNAFPQYTVTSYVPPSNTLSVEGREALKLAWKDLTVISSLYPQDGEGVAYVQEFEVADDGIIEMPRATSGYYEKVYDRWAEANTMTGVGVFSHFVHPDDVISEDRSNNMGWEQNYELFNEYMSRVQHTYPWVRALPATEAALDMAKNIYSHVTWSHSEYAIEGHVTNYRSESFYVFRTTSNIKSLTNCTVLTIDENTYLVTAKAANFKIELEEA